MKKDLKAAVVQYEIPKNFKEGEEKILRFVKEATEQKVDILGLPEECLAPQTDIRKGYNPFNFLSEISKTNSLYVFGSNVVKVGEKYFNRGFLFGKNGELLLENDKVVLSPEEKGYYSSGKNINIVDTEFGEIALLVCKDTFHRFAPWIFDELRKKDVDIVLNPTLSLNVAPTTIDYFVSSLKALSKWFGMYIVASGTVGKNMTEYKSHGHAVIVCPMRLVLKEGSFDKEEMLVETINPSYLEEYRKRSTKWQPEKVPEFKVVEK